MYLDQTLTIFKTHFSEVYTEVRRNSIQSKIWYSNPYMLEEISQQLTSQAMIIDANRNVSADLLATNPCLVAELFTENVTITVIVTAITTLQLQIINIMYESIYHVCVS